MAVQLLAELHQWLEMKKPHTAKGSLTYKAICYALNQWEKLVRYCEEGRLNISNAGAENAICPFVLGRRRWLFCDTPEGARASAVHFSPKANDLNPEEYYRYILPRIAYAKATADWEALLPWNVNEALKKIRLKNRWGSTSINWRLQKRWQALDQAGKRFDESLAAGACPAHWSAVFDRPVLISLFYHSSRAECNAPIGGRRSRTKPISNETENLGTKALIKNQFCAANALEEFNLHHTEERSITGFFGAKPLLTQR